MLLDPISTFPLRDSASQEPALLPLSTTGFWGSPASGRHWRRLEAEMVGEARAPCQDDASAAPTALWRSQPLLGQHLSRSSWCCQHPSWALVTSPPPEVPPGLGVGGLLLLRPWGVAEPCISCTTHFLDEIPFVERPGVVLLSWLDPDWKIRTPKRHLQNQYWLISSRGRGHHSEGTLS